VQQEKRYENQSPLHFYRSRAVAVAAATSQVQEEKQYFQISTSTGSGNDISGKAVLVSSAAPLRQRAVATSLNKVFEEEKGDVVVELGGMRMFELSPLLSTLFCSRVSLLS